VSANAAVSTLSSLLNHLFCFLSTTPPRLTSSVRVGVCLGEPFSLTRNQIGDAGAISLGDAVRVNATLTHLL
jgi:hypothetical protein